MWGICLIRSIDMKSFAVISLALVEDSFILFFSFYFGNIEVFFSFIYKFFENLYGILRVISELLPNIVNFTTKVLAEMLLFLPF